MKKRSLLLFYIGFILFLEYIFHIRAFGGYDVGYVTLFTLPIIIFIYILSTLFSPKVNKIITYVMTIGITVMFVSQLIYYQIYNAIFSLGAVSMAGQVATFYDQILDVTKDNIFYIILMIIPALLFIIFNKKYLNFDRMNYLNAGKILLGTIIFHFIVVLSLNINNQGVYSLYNIYHNVNSPVLMAKNMGLITEMRVDIKRGIFGFTEKLDSLIINNNNEAKEPTVELNITNIEFDTLIENETDETLKTMHQYFKNQSATEKNQYTGLLEGKNVIFVLAESLDRIAIDETLTPTLYKLAHEGLQFSNYYTPLFPTSTADGEYMAEWGILPQLNNKDNLYDSRNNYNPYLLVNALKDSGYQTYAYHNHIYDFYRRGEYLESLGYETIKFCDTGLNIPCNANSYRGSDISLIENSINDYLNTDKFFTYYITVSGHGSYYYDRNPFARKYQSYVADLPYHSLVKNYLAANIELDKALEILIDQLTQAGKLEDTVLVITPDHWPYYFDSDNYDSLQLLNQADTIDRYQGYEIHHENLIIWNPSLPNVVIDKVSSNIDILPTMLNLLGIEYDSRLIIGQDILADGAGLAIFADRGWITEKGVYNGNKGKFTATKGEEVDSEYVETMNNIVNNKFKISSLIQDKDYYGKIFLNEREEA